MEIGATVLPHFPKDTTDRNRTSPFAFTGNKFEFRMLGSTFSISGANIVLNTAVAEILSQFADELEKADDFNVGLKAIIKDTIRKHKRIIFNGNNYSNKWLAEAEKRGLLNLKSTAEALPYFKSEKSVNLFAKHKIFTKAEVYSRCELLLEGYVKVLNIEALTMLEMAKKDIIPALVTYSKELSDLANSKKSLNADIPAVIEEETLIKLSKLGTCIFNKINALDMALLDAKNYSDIEECSVYYNDVVFNEMCELRQVVDEAETIIAAKYLPYPTYGEILFSV
jgi:glutamine synthetase